MKLPPQYAKFLLVVISMCFSLLLGEGVLRIFLNPVDYLKPVRIHDEILGAKISPHSAGHDSWGFRNKLRPSHSEILAIGDSQTYGSNATANYSWPAILQRILNMSVYNMGMGGYSPTQYYYLLKEQGLELNPSLVIVGFYYGNDLMETYRNVYAKDGYWQYLRSPDFSAEQTLNVAEYEFAKPFFVAIRVWLSHHSLLYKKIGYLIGDIIYRLETQFHRKQKNVDFTLLENKENNIYTALTPHIRLSALDVNKPEVMEGLRISLELLSQMNELCQKNNMQFLVMLIPTKESVHSSYIENNAQLIVLCQLMNMG